MKLLFCLAAMLCLLVSACGFDAGEAVTALLPPEQTGQPVLSTAETVDPIIPAEILVEDEPSVYAHIPSDRILWIHGSYTGRAGSFFEHGDTLYFVSAEGDCIYTKTGDDISVFYTSDIGKIDGILIDGDWLYFQIYSMPVICRIHLESGSFETILDTDKADYYDSLDLGGYSLSHDTWGFSMYKGIIYIHSSLSVYGYDIDSDLLFLLKFDVSAGAFSGNTFFSIDKAHRTFSLYATDLDTRETKLVRGAGITWEFGESSNRTQYRAVAALNNDLLFIGGGVWLYREDGNDILLCPSGSDWLYCADRDMWLYPLDRTYIFLQDANVEKESGISKFGTDRRYLYIRNGYPGTMYYRFGRINE
jgi:hypothetical protein